MPEQRALGDRFQAFNDSILGLRAVVTELEELQRIEFALAFSDDGPHETGESTLNKAALRRLRSKATPFANERLANGPSEKEREQ